MAANNPRRLPLTSSIASQELRGETQSRPGLVANFQFSPARAPWWKLLNAKKCNRLPLPALSGGISGRIESLYTIARRDGRQLGTVLPTNDSKLSAEVNENGVLGND